MSLKELIDLHISGAGNGFEIDDIMSSGKYPQDIVDKILEIERKYRSEQYQIGVSNPASFPDLKKIADAYSTM